MAESKSSTYNVYVCLFLMSLEPPIAPAASGRAPRKTSKLYATPTNYRLSYHNIFELHVVPQHCYCEYFMGCMYPVPCLTLHAAVNRAAASNPARAGGRSGQRSGGNPPLISRAFITVVVTSSQSLDHCTRSEGGILSGLL